MRRRVVVSMSLLLAVGVACDDSSTPEAAPRPAECTEPEFEPTYLPWVKGSIPEPEQFAAQLNFTEQWVTPSGAKQVAKVTLVRTYRPWKETTHMPEVPVRGTEGHLIWIGDPGVGELALPWSEGDEPCDHYVLYLLDQSLNEREAEREMGRISRSLR